MPKKRKKKQSLKFMAEGNTFLEAMVERTNYY